MSAWELYKQLFERNWRCGKFFARFVSRVLREDQKERRCHDNSDMVKLINSDPAVLDDLVICDESWIYGYDPETKRQRSQWQHAGSPRPKKARQSKSTQIFFYDPPFFFFWQHWQDQHILGSHWTDSQQGILDSSLIRLSGISSRTMHQSTTQSLYRLIDQDGHQDSSSASI